MPYSFYFFKKSIKKNVSSGICHSAKIAGGFGDLVAGPLGGIILTIPGALIGGVGGLFSGIIHGTFVSLTRDPKSDAELNHFFNQLENIKNNHVLQKEALLNAILENYERYSRNHSQSTLKLLDDLKKQTSADDKFNIIIHYLTAKIEGSDKYHNNGKLFFNIAYHFIVNAQSESPILNIECGQEQYELLERGKKASV